MIVIGMVLLTVSVLVFFLARMRSQNDLGVFEDDTIQSLYAMLMVLSFSLGVMSIGAGLSGVGPF